MGCCTGELPPVPIYIDCLRFSAVSGRTIKLSGIFETDLWWHKHYQAKVYFVRGVCRILMPTLNFALRVEKWQWLRERGVAKEFGVGILLNLKVKGLGLAKLAEWEHVRPK